MPDVRLRIYRPFLYALLAFVSVMRVIYAGPVDCWVDPDKLLRC